jgi:AraC-like DNA-binding protein
MYRPYVASTSRDPLADVLALLRPAAVLAAELVAHGRWSLEFAAAPAVKFGVVVAGECLIAVRGRAPKALHAGDIFLLGGPAPFVMASDMETPSRSAHEVLSRAGERVARLGNARAKPTVHLFGGHFLLEPANAHLLVDALPSFVRIPADEASSLRGLIPLFVDEVRSMHLGRVRALDQLAQLVLTYALRWLDSDGKSLARTSWLRALADSHIGAALRHIHSNVEGGTSLAELARVAGMSRTAFAARFKELVGRPPLAYAIQWRMSLAKDALRTTDSAIGELAFKFGYESESAFSMAFRREVGCSPRAYRQQSFDVTAPQSVPVRTTHAPARSESGAAPRDTTSAHSAS